MDRRTRWQGDSHPRALRQRQRPHAYRRVPTPPRRSFRENRRHGREAQRLGTARGDRGGAASLPESDVGTPPSEWLRVSNQVSSEREAFERYLGDGGPATVPKERLPWSDAIAITQAAGGVAGLAHPPYNLNEVTLARLVEGGLGSIEVAGPGINPRCGKRWRDWAEKMGIVPIAGSDFHAQDRPGRWVGSVTTSAEDLENLLGRAKFNRPTSTTSSS